jgi:hypothetical protein
MKLFRVCVVSKMCLSVRHPSPDSDIIIRKSRNSMFQYTIPVVPLNTQDLPSAWLPTQVMTCSQRCFRLYIYIYCCLQRRIGF